MIPKQLQDESFRFCLIRRQEKTPFEPGWQGINNYRWDDKRLVEHINNGGNVGIVGGFGDIITLDVDDQEVRERVKESLPETLEIRSGSGNINFVYRCKKIESVKKEENGRELFSIRGKGSQALIPPSIHPSGNPYTLVNGNTVSRIRLRELEEALKEWWEGKTRDIEKILKGAEKGERNNALFSLAVFLKKTGIPEKEAAERIKKWNERNVPPLDVKEIRKTVESAFTKDYSMKFTHDPNKYLVNESLELEEKGRSWESIIPLFYSESTPKMKALSETANFLMEKYHFKTPTDNEEIWVFTNPVYEKLGEQTIKKEMWSNLWGLIRQQDVTQVIEQIRAMTYIERPEYYDWNLIPLKNGWYDLEKDELTKPDPSKFMINSLPVEYNPEADCPRIKKFVSEIVSEDDVPIVQEMIGYCLLKNYKWNKAFMLLGSGSNGKTTLLNLIKTFRTGKRPLHGLTARHLQQ